MDAVTELPMMTHSGLPMGHGRKSSMKGRSWSLLYTNWRTELTVFALPEKPPHLAGNALRDGGYAPAANRASQSFKQMACLRGSKADPTEAPGL